MSNIPSSAMPRAKADDGKDKTAKSDKAEKGSGASLKQRAGKIADKARENPKTSIAAGAAVLAGAVAAAAIPLVKASRAKAADGKTSAKKSAAAKKSNVKKS